MRYLLPILFLVGCNEDPNEIQTQGKVEAPTTKWKVETQGYFKAGYDNNKREILIITSPNNRKYLAITGCGVTEIVTVGSGDSKKSVEE